MFQCRRPSRSGPARSTDRWPRYRPSRRTPSPGPLADRPSPQPASLAGPATSASGQWPAPNGRASARRLRRWCRLVGDVDDAFHAEFGVLAVVLGVKEAGQHPEAGPDVDDLLFSGAVVRALKKVVKPVARCCAWPGVRAQRCACRGQLPASWAASRLRSRPCASSSSRSGLGLPGVQPSPVSCRRLRRLRRVPSGSRAS